MRSMRVVTLTGRRFGLAVLLLQTAAVWANQPPQVLDIAATPQPASQGQVVHVVAMAQDPEGGPLTYQWSTADGTISGAGDQDPVLDWTLPSHQGNFLLSVRVSDAQSGSTLAEITVAVGPLYPYARFTGPLVEPARIAAGTAGDLWITDAARGRVEHFSTEGFHLGGFATGPRPLGIAVQNATTLLVGEDGLDRVARYSTSGALMGTLGEVVGMPNGLAVETSSGRIYAVDSEANLLRVFASDGSAQTPIGSGGLLDFPVDVAVLPGGAEIYVADQNTSRVFVFTPAGTVLRTLGAAGYLPGQFSRISGVALDTSGRLLVLDSQLGNIQLLESTGTSVATIGHVGDWGGALRTPLGLASVPGERVFVASGGTSEIEVFAHTDWQPVGLGTGLMLR